MPFLNWNEKSDNNSKSKQYISFVIIIVKNFSKLTFYLIEKVVNKSSNIGIRSLQSTLYLPQGNTSPYVKKTKDTTQTFRIAQLRCRNRIEHTQRDNVVDRR